MSSLAETTSYSPFSLEVHIESFYETPCKTSNVTKYCGAGFFNGDSGFEPGDQRALKAAVQVLQPHIVHSHMCEPYSLTRFSSLANISDLQPRDLSPLLQKEVTQIKGKVCRVAQSVSHFHVSVGARQEPLELCIQTRALVLENPCLWRPGAQ